jgi:hypothetical protein
MQVNDGYYKALVACAATYHGICNYLSAGWLQWLNHERKIFEGL